MAVHQLHRVGGHEWKIPVKHLAGSYKRRALLEDLAKTAVPLARLAPLRKVREVVGEFRELTGGSEERQTVLKRNLLIFSARILDSRVEAGMLSWAAAPDGPETRPPLAANALSIASLS